MATWGNNRWHLDGDKEKLKTQRKMYNIYGIFWISVKFKKRIADNFFNHGDIVKIAIVDGTVSAPSKYFCQRKTFPKSSGTSCPVRVRRCVVLGFHRSTQSYQHCGTGYASVCPCAPHRMRLFLFLGFIIFCFNFLKIITKCF